MIPQSADSARLALELTILARPVESLAILAAAGRSIIITRTPRSRAAASFCAVEAAPEFFVTNTSMRSSRIKSRSLS